MEITYTQAFFLGLLQGVTEFLPISSSGHLVIAQRIWGMQDAPSLLLFDVAIHLGTLAAVVVAYSKDLIGIFDETKSFLLRRPGDYPRARLGGHVLLATLPAVVVGGLLSEAIEPLFVSIRSADLGLLFTGLVLWATKLFATSSRPLRDSLTAASSLAIGLAQAVAIVPGISRSGMTIAVGLLCGLRQSLAARFSFLMSIPAILGAGVLELRDVDRMTAIGLGPLLVGTATAGVVGYLSIHFLLRVVQDGRIHLFAYYCWAVGLLSLLTL